MVPAISVIVPVYNREKKLSKCVESILSQSFENFELILVDDGSTDASLEVCNRYAERDDRVKVMHKSNGGVSSARNVGLCSLRGEYITFIDSDDYIESDFFQYAYSKSKEYNADIFATRSFIETWNNNVVTNRTYDEYSEGLCDVKGALEDWAVQGCRSGSWLVVWGKLYKANIIIDNSLGFDTSMKWGEDTCFNLDVLSKSKKIYCSKECFYHYVKEDKESLTSGLNKDGYDIQFKILESRKKIMNMFGCSSKSMSELVRYFFDCVFDTMCAYQKYYKQVTSKERYALIRKIANNEDIRKMKAKNMKWSKKIILILLRLKLYNFTWLVISLYFKVKQLKLKSKICSVATN